MTNGDATGKTLKELVLDLDRKVDGLDRKFDEWLDGHERRHRDDEATISAGRSSPDATPAGRTVSASIASLQTAVAAHERTIQRLYGAVGLASMLGFGALLVVFGRMSGLLA